VRDIERSRTPGGPCRVATPLFLLVALMFAAAVLAAAAWEGGLDRDSIAAHASVVVAVLIVAATAVVCGRGRQRQRSRAWLRSTVEGWRGATTAYRAGVVVWVLLLGAVVGWDLTSFAAQAHDLPTLSRLVGVVSGHRGGRSALFALWLSAGVALALGGRTERR
jgi:hypothetical protein